jgi:hypothetical protein
MASLTGQTIQSTYDSLLKISGNDPLTASLQRITDGLGNFTPLYLSTTAVEISSGLNVVGSITGSNLSGTNTGDETNSSIKTKLGAASASQDGYLTSTDWSTFNAKQPALGYTPVPQTRTLTINGTTFDLSADRSWTISTGVTRSQIITALGTGGSPFEFLKSDGSVDTNSYVTFGRTLTINGETYDLSANRSWTIPTSQWITSGSSIYYNTGTVGIGTTTPDSLLHLQSSTVDTRINLNSTNASLTPYIMFKSLGVNKATVGLGQYTGGSLNNLLLYCDSGDTIFSNNVERMRVINTGQLRLSSYTSTTSFTGTAAGYLAFDSSGNIITTATPSSSQWTTSGSNIFYNTGNVGIGTTSPNSYDASGNNLVVYEAGNAGITVATPSTGYGNIFFADGTGSAAAYAGYIEYNHNNDALALGTASTERMRITSAGNVGIGTTTPNSATNYSTLSVNGSSGGQITWQTGGSLIGYAYNTVNGLVLGANTDKILVFDAGASERMRITSAGNVGIGTTSPSFRLQVEGAFGTSPGAYISGTTYGTIGANRGASSASAGVNYYSVGSQRWFSGIFENTDDYGFYSVGTNSFPLVIKYNTGNVGIGTTSPAQRLHVNNTSSSTAAIFQGSSNSYIQLGVTNECYVGNNSNNLSLEAGGSERVRITSGGSLCVNTAGGPVINNTTLSTRSLTTTATDRVIEGYSVGFSALFYVQNNGSYFFAGSNLSDARTKKDINYLNDSVLDKVMQLKPASFKYIQNDENVKGGFIAQDVKEIFPDLVTKTQSEEDMMGVDYYGVIGILTKAIQESVNTINDLKSRIEQLESK